MPLSADLDTARIERLQAESLATAQRYDWRQTGLLMEGLLRCLLALEKPRRVAGGPAG